MSPYYFIFSNGTFILWMHLEKSFSLKYEHDLIFSHVCVCSLLLIVVISSVPFALFAITEQKTPHKEVHFLWYHSSLKM